MGTTFTNLQIRISDQNILEEQLTSEFYYLQTAEEWYTVLEKDSEHDFDRMTKLGRQLSKTAEGPVLLVHYFDDDVFELQLLSKGNKLGSYQAEISRNFCRKSAAFVEALDLSTKEAQAFRYLIKQEMSPSESIHWLSRLFGARLYADKGLLGNKKKLWRKDTAAVLSEIADEKKAAKVDNQTDLILLDEILGMNIQDNGSDKDLFEDRRDRLVRISLLNSDGSRNFSQITYFQELDGRFVKVYEYKYPEEIFTQNDFWLRMSYMAHWFRIVDIEGGHAFGKTTFDDRPISWRQWAPIFSEDRKIPPSRKQDISHLPEWRQTSAHEYTYSGGYYYRHSYGVVEKIDPLNSGYRFEERKIVAEYHYDREDGYYWEPETPLCVIDDMIVVMLIRGKPHSLWRAINVRFFDLNLKLLREEQILVKGKLPPSRYFCYDRELDTIFLNRMAVNLGTHEIVTCPTKLKEGSLLDCLDGRKNVYMLSGHSLYVLSADMKLLSHHTLKGSLMNYYKNARGNLCLITGSGGAERASQLKADAGIRIYEVVDKE